MSLPRRAAVAATAACLAAVPLVVSLGSADAAPERRAPVVDTEATDPTFTRHDVDTTITGAAFTTVGEVFAGEQDILTSGWGPFDGSNPEGPGSLKLYRPGATLDDWTSVTVFGPEAGIVMPNATTLADVDGDHDTDIIVPAGHFFGTDPKIPADQHTTGGISWWENTGPGTPFLRHDVTIDQPGAYHGVQLADLDGDGIRDIISVREEARTPDDLFDDTITTEFFRGRADHTFAAPVALADVGGSQPVVADVDGDGDLDIASARYFDMLRDGQLGSSYPAPSFLWLENTDVDGTLTAADFPVRTIATTAETGRGFQIIAVPDFRKPGKVSWIGTNHVNRCTWAILLPGMGMDQAERVMEFTPGKDIRAPWRITTLSDPDTPVEPCPADYSSNRDSYPVFSDAITSRWGPGQGAPGVTGYGDVDGDGDVDIAVAGDGDRRLWWIEKTSDGGTILHQLTQDGEHFGQSGGAAVVDFDGDGAQELVFSSWDQNTVAVWSASGASDVPETVTSKLAVSPASKAVRAGAKATWKVTLTAAPDGVKRPVTVVFDPRKGKDVALGTITLGPAGSATQTGRLTWKPPTAGTLRFAYAGTQASLVARDTPATATAKVTVKKR